MGIEETCYRICFQCDKTSHLGKKLLLSRLLDGMLYELDRQDPQKWLLNLSKEGKTILWGFLLHEKCLPDILQGIEESDWQPANIGEIVFQIPCFMGVCLTLWANRLKMDAPTLQKNFG